MKAGQKKSLIKWERDVFSQFKNGTKRSKIVDFCSSRRMRRLAKRKGKSDSAIEASRRFVEENKEFI